MFGQSANLFCRLAAYSEYVHKISTVQLIYKLLPMNGAVGYTVFVSTVYYRTRKVR